jgi:5-methylthioadenosine/S-adenosylhomocysteine deaminase
MFLAQTLLRCKQMNLLLKNCKLVITQNPERKILKGYDILVENGKIKEVRKSISAKDYEIEIVDCSKKIALPGLINCHTHSPMILLRGYKDDQLLEDWLKDIWQVEAKLKPKHVEIATLFACIEMIKSGTTCFVDMYFHMNSMLQAVKQAGIRAFLGYGMIDMYDWKVNEEKREKEITETLRWIKKVSEENNSLIRATIAPHAIYTCSQELLEKSNEIAKQYKLFKTIHLAETRKEVHDCWKNYGKRPVEWLDAIGFLDNQTIAFHASWLTKSEINTLAKKGVKVVHCPSSNLKLATGGSFPFREFLEAKATICLGTDGAASNNSLNMFSEMKFAALLQKWFRWNAKEMLAQQALDLATINSANALELNTGSIEVGKEADLILLDAKHYSLQPSTNVVSNLVYSASSEAVSDVIIAGKIVMRDRKIVTIDEEKVQEKFEKTIESLYGC